MGLAVTSRALAATLLVLIGGAVGWGSGLVFGAEQLGRQPAAAYSAPPPPAPPSRTTATIDAAPGQAVELTPDGRRVYQVALARLNTTTAAADGHLAVVAEFIINHDGGQIGAPDKMDEAGADAVAVGDDGNAYPAELPSGSPVKAWFDLPPGVNLAAVEWIPGGGPVHGKIARWRLRRTVLARGRTQEAAAVTHHTPS
jgi:hypothetical protein